MTTVSHTSLSTNSAPFAPAMASTIVQANCSGNIAAGADAPELVYLVNGQPTSFDPKLSFNGLEKGGTKSARAPSTGLTLQWRVSPGVGHSINTSVIT
jgi:hypothetical protein